MDTATIVEILESVPPLRLAAVRLYVEMQSRELMTAEIVERQEEIERALDELETHGHKTREVVRQCTSLMAIPAAMVACGF